MIPSPLVIASHNEGKVREIRDLLAPLAIEVLSAGNLGLPEPEETGTSFEENAAIKALAAAQSSGKYALSDDSGLCVEDLGDAPGIYSARWAGPKKDFYHAMDKIKGELSRSNTEPEGARAYFVCVLSLASPDGKAKSFEGRVTGKLTFPPRGEKGFGYDPIFIPEGYHHTFAEMEPAAKHAISHRAKAFEKFIEYLRRSSGKEAL